MKPFLLSAIWVRIKQSCLHHGRLSHWAN